MGARLLSIQVGWMEVSTNVSHRLLHHIRKHSLSHSPLHGSPSSHLNAQGCPEGHQFGLERLWLYPFPPGCPTLSTQLPCPQQCPRSHPGTQGRERKQSQRARLTASILRMRTGLTSSSNSQSASRMLWWYSSSSRLFCSSSARAAWRQ